MLTFLMYIFSHSSPLAPRFTFTPSSRSLTVWLFYTAHLTTLYPTYPNLTVRTQQSAGTAGQPCYIAVVLYETNQPRRLSAQNPVIGYDIEQYYDDRIVAAADLARYTVLLNGTPGLDQTEGMSRLLERCEVLVRSGWRASASEG